MATETWKYGFANTRGNALSPERVNHYPQVLAGILAPSPLAGEGWDGGNE